MNPEFNYSFLKNEAENAAGDIFFVRCNDTNVLDKQILF